MKQTTFLPHCAIGQGGLNLPAMGTRTRTTTPPIVVGIAEAARLLGVSRQTIYDMNSRGVIPIIRLADTKRSVVRYSDLMNLVDGSKHKEVFQKAE